ncbi:hypothetical protein EJ06DRAFT_508996 [Trichodelitschia bisporula]|uniref:Leo1-domain-containing protein n=1 Tax=Trichodelitschia bisporula TaxID=703511 RepID=A0A6G1HZC6_9PEZI|nr:hypothetical protein EJ06DRAFT_508996 [Trichodelitschia bisporula]
MSSGDELSDHGLEEDVNGQAPEQNAGDGLGSDSDSLPDVTDDLFGEGDEDLDETHANGREVDGNEDEDEDEGSPQRQTQGSEEPLQETSQEADIPRHPVPYSSDNEVYLLRVPRFLAIDPAAFVLQTFQPPTTEHHSRAPPSPSFSAYKTAMTTIRWRHSPSNPAELQSNARILRWSDGSMTLQLASDPLTQYEFGAKPLAPAQRNPVKPTPARIQDDSGRTPQYDEKADTFTYLASASRHSYCIRVVDKMTTSLQVNPILSTDDQDEAIQRLKASMATAATAHTSKIAIEQVTEDPELAKKRAEIAEREKMKNERRIQARAERERDKDLERRRDRGGEGGLSFGALETETGTGRSRGVAGRPKPRRQRRDDYSSDEDAGYRGRHGEDEYDDEDDFIAHTDDEEEDAEGEEEDIDTLIEQNERRQRGGESPKRKSSDEDAEGGGQDQPVARKRRRVVIDEDDEESE